ncbi:MAG: hypothetical protein OEW06_16270, partial [Gemmatimonadota bacterium]|nr:hypothetical protein [Gemmatimonadota bacterium]
ILTVGDERYVLLEDVPTDLPYHLARVETFDDHDLTAPQLDELANQARGQFARFVAGMQALSDRPQEALQLHATPQATSFQIAAALEMEGDVKQELLAMRSTNERLQRLLQLLRPLNDELERRVAVHARARGNGGGGHARDIVTGE